ncbi:hypothetical protein GFU89_08125 [Chryseobacterium sp. JV558]|nr:hypothetical protein [Chryseobacterium sp. JV558]
MYDYGARMLIPDLGRWGAMDAMSEKYSAWSPYNYAINNPVMVIDPDGNDISYSGEAAQQAFKAYVATMSTSSETSGGSSFTGFGRAFGEDPKPGFWGRVNNWWDRWFGKSKKAAIGAITIGAATFEGFAPPVEFGPTVSRLAVYARMGLWSLPLMLNGDSSHASGYDIPLTGAIDIPVTTTADESEPEKKITLYRGVHNQHPDYMNALKGEARPYSLDGHDSPEDHNGGNFKSLFTSWTISPAVANYHANKKGAGGVVLIKTISLKNTVPSPDNYDELEILIPGVVKGATVIAPTGPGSPTAY